MTNDTPHPLVDDHPPSIALRELRPYLLSIHGPVRGACQLLIVAGLSFVLLSTSAELAAVQSLEEAAAAANRLMYDRQVTSWMALFAGFTSAFRLVRAQVGHAVWLGSRRCGVIHVAQSPLGARSISPASRENSTEVANPIGGAVDVLRVVTDHSARSALAVLIVLAVAPTPPLVAIAFAVTSATVLIDRVLVAACMLRRRYFESSRHRRLRPQAHPAG